MRMFVYDVENFTPLVVSVLTVVENMLKNEELCCEIFPPADGTDDSILHQKIMSVLTDVRVDYDCRESEYAEVILKGGSNTNSKISLNRQYFNCDATDGVQKSRMKCFLVIKMLHAVTHIVTELCNSLEEEEDEEEDSPTLKVRLTVGRKPNERDRGDCGYVLEQRLFGGFIDCSHSHRPFEGPLSYSAMKLAQYPINDNYTDRFMTDIWAPMLNKSGVCNIDKFTIDVATELIIPNVSNKKRPTDNASLIQYNLDSMLSGLRVKKRRKNDKGKYEEVPDEADHGDNNTVNPSVASKGSKR